VLASKCKRTRSPRLAIVCMTKSALSGDRWPFQNPAAERANPRSSSLIVSADRGTRMSIGISEPIPSSAAVSRSASGVRCFSARRANTRLMLCPNASPNVAQRSSRERSSTKSSFSIRRSPPLQHCLVRGVTLPLSSSAAAVTTLKRLALGANGSRTKSLVALPREAQTKTRPVRTSERTIAPSCALVSSSKRSATFWSAGSTAAPFSFGAPPLSWVVVVAAVCARCCPLDFSVAVGRRPLFEDPVFPFASACLPGDRAPTAGATPSAATRIRADSGARERDTAPT
jgi:hypothetical protein